MPEIIQPRQTKVLVLAINETIQLRQTELLVLDSQSMKLCNNWGKQNY